MRLCYPAAALLFALLLFGCASSAPTTSQPPGATSTPAQAKDTASTDSSDAEGVMPLPNEAPQDWYHLARAERRIPGLATQKAYDTLLPNRAPQDTVVVAIIDSGVDIEHEDLSAEVWTNADEVPGNNEDDDGNGYVDDAHGWNFIGGPDGENVNQDTYELTRIYADLRARFQGVDSSAVAAEERAAYQRYQTIRAEFRDEKQQAQQRLRNVRKTRDAVDMASTMLRKHLSTDTLTQAKVESVSGSTRQVQRSRDVLMRLYRQGLSPSDVQEYYDALKRRVDYNYDPDFTPRSIVDDDYSDKAERIYGNSDVTGPDAGHGTHVAGIVGATRTNDLGIRGVARGVRIMSVRAVPNGDERDKDVANAIRYAVDNGADVINMSFGKAYSPHKDVVDAAVRYADSSGVLMVHAAGNDGADVDSVSSFPTRYYESGGRADLWIEVGASSWKADSTLAAPFSNYGDETVDVFAPGDAIYSTTPNNAYERNSGTSMAAPMVSGLAALLMAHYPDLTAAQVREIVLDTAPRFRDVMVSKPGSSTRVRFGTLSRTGAVVSAFEALQRAESIAAE